MCVTETTIRLNMLAVVALTRAFGTAVIITKQLENPPPKIASMAGKAPPPTLVVTNDAEEEMAVLLKDLSPEELEFLEIIRQLEEKRLRDVLQKVCECVREDI